MRKNSNICFKLKDGNEWKTATLIFRSDKATRKYKNALNNKLDDGTMQSTDYERDLVSLKHLPKSSASNATYPQTNTEKILCSKIYLSELENQTMAATMTELENWKKQEVYREEKDMGQSCISFRWVLSRKVKNGENITKERPCARGFEEVKDSPTEIFPTVKDFSMLFENRYLHNLYSNYLESMGNKIN